MRERFLDFRRIDLLLLGITVVLTLFGLAMIASVSVFKSYQLTETNSFYLWRSLFHICIGFGAMGVTTVIPYHFWQRHARIFFFLTMILLVLVLLPHLSALRLENATSKSWLLIRGFSIQPSELLKLTMIFYLAIWLQKREQLIGTFHEGFMPFAILLVVCTLLVAIEPDLGSFLILTSIASVMFFIAGGNIFHLFLGGILAFVLGLPVILQKEYIRDRFVAFLRPDDPRIALEEGFQIKQALTTIGSGGIFGVGYGKSIQKFGYLPEVQSDMIFSAMGEELGFLRLLIILAMYAILVLRGYRVAQHAPDRFGFLVAAGITTWIAVQTIVNIAVNIGLFPITGLTLPLISYGGSSLISTLMGIGILLNISMHSTEEAALARRVKKKQGGWLMRGA